LPNIGMVMRALLNDGLDCSWMVNRGPFAPSLSFKARPRENTLSLPRYDQEGRDTMTVKDRFHGLRSVITAHFPIHDQKFMRAN
jgi:hypothetical protein